MRNLKKKIVATVMALCMLFASTVYAMDTPIPDFSSFFNENSIYGSYYQIEGNSAIEIDVKITYDYVTDRDNIFFYSTYRNGITDFYTGILEYIGGNVYITANGGGEYEGALMLTFGNDGGMLVTIISDPMNKFDSIAGLYTPTY